VIATANEANSENEHRRSTRIPLELSIEVDGKSGILPFKAVTVIVNLHGALIRTVRPLEVGSTVYLRVLSGEEALARVIHVDPSQPLTYGIELSKPQNIWGITLPPHDWQEMSP
jgi:hypothetical protein